MERLFVYLTPRSPSDLARSALPDAPVRPDRPDTDGVFGSGAFRVSAVVGQECASVPTAR